MSPLLDVSRLPRGERIEFTWQWQESGAWHGRDYQVAAISVDETYRPSAAQTPMVQIGRHSSRLPQQQWLIQIIRAFYCCTVVIVVLDAKKVLPPLVRLHSVGRYKMSTLDEITSEKQRITEALARVEAQREKLTSQLTDLEATERV